LGATALREIITAGEQLQVTKHIKNLFELLGNCTLTNQYGPTESHVVTSYTLKGEPSNWTALPPIGRPIDNTQIYLLNKNLEPVPIGVVGELYIGGVNLARGYLNRPQLTNEKFVPDPFSEAVGSRLYRTGDLARYLPDGNIEFLGRADDQVKIRGFRIELGEIEAILGQHPSIRENVVSSFEDDTGTNKLVAHVSLNTNEMLSVSELRRFLSQKLPEYMVPSIVIFLDDLPLLPSGKVNRRTLPIPNANRPDLEAAFVAPRNSIEWQIALIWQEVLNLEKVGVNDNFFELGGHSLSLTQVVARMQQAFQLEIPLRTIFKNTTVAAQAQSVEKIFADSQFAMGERADNKTDREFLEL
jgi:acyl carrier protein